VPATDARSPSDLERLRTSSELTLLLPDEPGFETARLAWNLAHEHHPLAVARPRSTAGVVEVVSQARALGLGVAIQATGHGPTRSADGVILLDLSQLDEVLVDAVAQRAVVGGGTKWQAVLDAVVPHGLTPLLGSSPDVGAVGYTLGGGIGWLARAHGAAADSVRSFDVVLADGRVVRASAEDEPELFWALRGAGQGHLGVVTAMEIELYEVGELYAGNLFYPVGMATEVMRRWRDWLPALPQSLTSSVSFMNFPVLDIVPEPLRGQSFAVVRGALPGPLEVGEGILAYWREWQPPVIDLFGPLPMARVAEVSQDPLDPLPVEVDGYWLRRLSDATIDELVTTAFPTDGPPPFLFVEIRHTALPASNEPESLIALATQDATMLLTSVAITPTLEAAAAVRATVDALLGRVAPDLTGRPYLNFVEGARRRERVEAALGIDAYRRLAALKSRLDPDDLFDHGLDVTR
jgi:FAD/FMN-containing dehydrogenase